MTEPHATVSQALAALPLPSSARFLVAFSGGLDSTVLLHALAAHQPGQVRACHVHHGLQAAADDWLIHCRRRAASIAVPLVVRHVHIDPADPAGPEAAARTERYAALRQAMGEGEVLVTAHHRDDQAETVLLRLLRGSGLRGLSAIQPLTVFEPGQLWRPFLDLPRAALQAYAEHHRLDWIEDPHNDDLRYRRSWLRQTILPALRQQFPQLDERLAQAARHAAETVELTDALAAIDRADLAHAAGSDDSLSVTALLALTAARRRNLLRHWLNQQGFALPAAAMLGRIDTEMLHAKPDAEPILHWSGCELRRYRDRLFAMPPLAPPPPAEWSGEWCSGTVFPLPAGCGHLHSSAPPPAALGIRFPRLGESVRSDPAGPSKTLKNCFQQAGIPPWTRLRMPVVEYRDEVALIPGLALVTASGQLLLNTRWQVEWSPLPAPPER